MSTSCSGELKTKKQCRDQMHLNSNNTIYKSESYYEDDLLLYGTKINLEIKYSRAAIIRPPLCSLVIGKGMPGDGYFLYKFTI